MAEKTRAQKIADMESVVGQAKYKHIDDGDYTPTEKKKRKSKKTRTKQPDKTYVNPSWGEKNIRLVKSILKGE